MSAAAAAGDDAVPRLDDAQGEVGVLAIRTGEPRVESADLDEDVAAVGHVGGDPAGVGQPVGATLVVGRAPIGRRGHDEGALRSRRARGTGGREVVGERARPPGVG